MKLSSCLDGVSEDPPGAPCVMSPQHQQPGSLLGPGSLLPPLSPGTWRPVAVLPAAVETHSAVRGQAGRQKPRRGVCPAPASVLTPAVD